MLIIRGVNVFPSQVEAALLTVEGTTPHYMLVVDRVDNTDTLEVQVEVAENFFTDEIKSVRPISLTLRKQHLRRRQMISLQVSDPRSLRLSTNVSFTTISARTPITMNPLPITRVHIQ